MLQRSATERIEGPIFLGLDGQRLDHHAAWRIVHRLARMPASTSKSVRTRTAMRSSPRPSSPGA